MAVAVRPLVYRLHIVYQSLSFAVPNVGHTCYRPNTVYIPSDFGRIGQKSDGTRNKHYGRLVAGKYVKERQPLVRVRHKQRRE